MSAGPALLPSQYRLESEHDLFLAYCKQWILHPAINCSERIDFLNWIAPSYNVSNGYFEETIEEPLLVWMLARYGTKSTSILNRILHTIHFLTLTTSKEIQQELLKWLQISGSSSSLIVAEKPYINAPENINSTNLTEL